jgi:hypothetical protein
MNVKYQEGGGEEDEEEGVEEEDLVTIATYIVV